LEGWKKTRHGRNPPRKKRNNKYVYLPSAMQTRFLQMDINQIRIEDAKCNQALSVIRTRIFVRVYVWTAIGAPSRLWFWPRPEFHREWPIRDGLLSLFAIFILLRRLNNLLSQCLCSGFLGAGRLFSAAIHPERTVLRQWLHQIRCCSRHPSQWPHQLH